MGFGRRWWIGCGSGYVRGGWREAVAAAAEEEVRPGGGSGYGVVSFEVDPTVGRKR
ncbi:hypothetical protein HPP92_016052 [Vanilla planifolia]|uniref:Uncharacterized protein n=1 Tax=Vanilla planifolia TaxID=51239 RepID=A0A835UTU4_VANPL|nr:hypothetical protein HPP92_016661 [Vanilla planifolia]KAG0471506.1 hypothetical protein HPP92_016052 [Vanilla planifolia]